VGAPWSGRNFLDTFVYCGNGGFSLRNVSFMIHCLENSKILDNNGPSEPEDYYFAYCAQLFGTPTPFELARYFSIETIDSPDALGLHAICSYGRHLGCNKDWVKNWLTKCPESSSLFRLNGTVCDDGCIYINGP